VLSISAPQPSTGNVISSVQRQEDEEELQTKPLVASITPLIQRQEEDEEELQAKSLQRQEDEEELQTKPLQRQEDVEELQAKSLQRQEDEEELQTKPLQRQEDEEEVQAKALQLQEDEEEIQAKSLQRQEDEEELQTKPLQRQEDEEELQTKPLQRQARDKDGFEAGPRIESRLASARGSGAPLPGELRAYMEPRFGADFSSVRIHTGSEAAQLNRDLSAQAFTQGQHIYMGGGRFDPGSTQGKHLLAHELTHVVQQTGSQPPARIKRKDIPSGEFHQAQLQVGKEPQVPQLQRAGLDKLEEQTIPTGQAPPLPPRPVLQPPPLPPRTTLQPPPLPPRQGLQPPPLPPRTTLQPPPLPPRPALQPPPLPPKPTGRAPLPPTLSAQLGKGAGLLTIGGRRPPTQKQLEKANVAEEGESKAETVKSFTGWMGGMVNPADEMLVDMYRRREMKEEGTGTGLVIPEGAVWAVGGALGMYGGIVGMAKSLKDICNSEKDAYERVQAAFDLATAFSDYMGGGIGVAGGVSQIVGQAKDSDLATSSSSWFLGFGDMFGTLSSGIKTIKGVVNLVHMRFEKAEHGKEEWTVAGYSALNSALETAKGVFKSIRSMNEAMGGVMTSAASQLATQVALGLDIAINAFKSIMQGYYLIKSAVYTYKMNQRKNKLESKLFRKGGFSKEKVSEATKFYDEREGMIATLDDLIAKNEQTIKEKREELKNPTRWTRFKGKFSDPQKKITELEQQNRTYATNKAKIQAEIQGRKQDQMLPQAKDIAELRLAGELRWVNTKRIVRQSIHITTNLVQIGASIASFVSGPGAPAALALKATAAGIDTSLPFFRWIKQKSRDLAAERAAKKGEVSNKFLRVDKSSAAKLQARKNQAVSIMMMAVKLNDYVPTGTNPPPEQIAKFKKHAERVETYIRATGCSPKKLYRENGKPMEQVKILVKELSKRELGED
jgi:hypothetical protein